MAGSDGWGRARDDDDSTREFHPAPGALNQNQYQNQYQYQEPERKSAVGTFFLVFIPLLIIALVAVVLIWRWDDLFGAGDDGAASTPEATQTQVPTQEAPETTTETPAETQDAARPDSAQLPGDVEPVNAAARNNEPTGDFNSVFKSPPAGDNYTSDEFAEAVRDAFVEAYLDNGQTDQSLDVASPVTDESYRMDCTDEGSYVHCSGGNDANVYIA